MTPALAFAGALGICLGLGLWTLVSMVPRIGGRRLIDRVAPYVQDVSAEAREMTLAVRGEPGSVLVTMLAPLSERVQSAVSGLLGGDASVEARLRQSGSAVTVAAFRSRQLLACAAGLALGIVVAILLARTSAMPPVVVLVLVVVATAGGLLLPEQLLAMRAKARLARITTELPTVLEFLSLSLAAGETVRDALRRVGRIGSGELAAELAGVTAEVDLGIPLSDALMRCADELQLPALSRVTEQLVSALDRGSPLVDVLRAQAQDSRNDAKRHLLESAGRKEVAMLVPLVFLILPVTIVFALYPATLVLQLGF